MSEDFLGGYPGGFSYCNPSWRAEDCPTLTNEQYVSTIPDGDPWKAVILENLPRLYAADPNWKVEQIKEKFNECRFYIDGNEEARKVASDIERLCNETEWVTNE